jgi:hypothetical protein
MFVLHSLQEFAFGSQDSWLSSSDAGDESESDGPDDRRMAGNLKSDYAF